MKQFFRRFSVSLLALILLLSACGQQDDPSRGSSTSNESLSLTVAMGGAQDTLTAAYSTADDSETILLHLYENLMRWEDDGSGYAKLAPGQAASYTVETDYAGNATYTFTLRDDIVWSDGQNVTAPQFAAAWQRIADPAYNSPYHALMSCIAGYEEVRSSGDSSLLAVSAPDMKTLVVTLNGSAPWFLEVVCAGAHTMPVRTYLPDNKDDQLITNGAYTAAAFSSQLVELKKSETYYDANNVTVDTLRFVPAAGSDTDYEKLLNGQLNFTVNLPQSALQKLAENRFWTPEAVTSTCGLLLNTLQPPFDNADVRLAFRLAVNESAIVDLLGSLALRPASGVIPYGVSDYGERDTEKNTETDENNDSDDSQRKPELIVPMYWDFRAHSETIVTLDISNDYDTDCAQAASLLAAAGYAGGNGFPTVEYLYIDSEESRLIAQALQTMWRENLGVNVVLRAVSAEEYGLMLQPTVDPESGEIIAQPAFQIAAQEFTASYLAPDSILFNWHSESAENRTGYASPAYDILLNAAKAATAPEAYDAYLHDAEAILLTDAPVIPLFYRGGTYALAENLEGLYRAPNGIYFFMNVKETEK